MLLPKLSPEDDKHLDVLITLAINIYLGKRKPSDLCQMLAGASDDVIRNFCDLIWLQEGE